MLSPVRHLLSCDNDPIVLEFIKEAKREKPFCFVTDILNTSDTFVRDETSQRYQPVPNNPGVAGCGWSCKSVILGGYCYSLLL